MKTLKSQVRILSNKKKNNIFLLAFFFIHMYEFFLLSLALYLTSLSTLFKSYNYHQLCSCSCWSETLYPLLYPLFSLEKKGYINFAPKFVHRPSIHPSVCPSITFVVNIYPSKPFKGATSNFYLDRPHAVGYWAIFRVTLTPRSRSKVR